MNHTQPLGALFTGQGVGSGWRGGEQKKEKALHYNLHFLFGSVLYFWNKNWYFEIFFFLKKDNILKVLLTHVNIPHVMAL